MADFRRHIDLNERIALGDAVDAFIACGTVWFNDDPAAAGALDIEPNSIEPGHMVGAGFLFIQLLLDELATLTGQTRTELWSELVQASWPGGTVYAQDEIDDDFNKIIEGWDE